MNIEQARVWAKLSPEELNEIDTPEIELFGKKIYSNPPETKPLELDETYFYVNPSSPAGYNTFYWENSEWDIRNLKRRLVFKDEADAVEVVKALGWYDED